MKSICPECGKTHKKIPNKCIIESEYELYSSIIRGESKENFNRQKAQQRKDIMKIYLIKTFGDIR